MTISHIKASHMLNTAMDGFSVLVEHETNALENLVSSLRERVVVARKARTVGELLRNQIDLLPDTGARLRRDHSMRRQLLAGFGRDLRGSLGQRHAA